MRFPHPMRLASLPVGLLLFAAPASTQTLPFLDGTYTYGALSAFQEGNCGSALPATTGELGSLSFSPAGTFTLSSSRHIACPGGVFWYDQPDLDSGTYTVAADGHLVMDFDPLNPGIEVVAATVLWNKDVILSHSMEAGETLFLVMIRQSSGLTNASLQGDYGTVGVGQAQEPGGLTTTTTYGSVTLDGSGHYNVFNTYHSVNAAGSQSGPAIDKGTYSVAADGTLTLDGGLGLGAVTHDGDFGFFVSREDEKSELSLFVRKPLVAPTTDALQDVWRLSMFGGGSHFAPPEMTPFGAMGELDFDAILGTWSFAGVLVWADSAGGSSQPDSASGTHFVGPDGAISIFPSGGGSMTGWLAAREDIGLLAHITDAFETQVLVFIRDWGPLSGSPQNLSLLAGGTQDLELRAGVAHAFRPYLILGSLSGYHPGFPLGFSTVPLNWDAYTAFTLQTPNTPPLSASSGQLGGSGAAVASFVLPAGSKPTLAGLTLWHAAVIVDPTALDLIGLVSNPVPLGLAP